MPPALHSWHQVDAAWPSISGVIIPPYLYLYLYLSLYLYLYWTSHPHKWMQHGQASVVWSFLRSADSVYPDHHPAGSSFHLERESFGEVQRAGWRTNYLLFFFENLKSLSVSQDSSFVCQTLQMVLVSPMYPLHCRLSGWLALQCDGGSHLPFGHLANENQACGLQNWFANASAHMRSMWHAPHSDAGLPVAKCISQHCKLYLSGL